MMLRKPTCADCPHNLQYMERLPIKKKGVTMHLGERFCVAGKRARKFKRSDPKTYVPSWCPRLKAPCELRIYGFKNQREWRMHRSMCAYLGEDTSPSAFRYAVRYEGHTDLAPYEFFECCNEKSDDEILGAAVQHYDVVEIDDGIKPAFFYKTEHGYDPEKGRLEQHIFAQLKYELLSCRSAYRLCGMTGAPHSFRKSHIISIDTLSENSGLYEETLAA